MFPDIPDCVDLHRLFNGGEQMAVCREASRRPEINPRVCFGSILF